jgi:uncharacterized membrane protein
MAENEYDDNGYDDEGDDVYETLRERLGGAGKSILLPAAASAAAALVAKKGPDLLKSLSEQGAESLDRARDAGGAKGFAAGAASKAMQGGGGSLVDRLTRGGEEEFEQEADEQGGAKGKAMKAMQKLSGSKGSGGSGWGKGRRLPILRHIDVAAPVEEVYDQWTNFDEFRGFMHRVEGVHEEGRERVTWSENIWGRRRQWKAKITEQEKNQKIAWEIESGGRGTGIITFHRLAPRLTRVEVVFDWQPQGIVEKFASGMRFHKRAAKADLYRFKAYVETGGRKKGGAAGGDDSDDGERDRSDGTSDEERERGRQEREQRRRERQKQGARR